MKSKTNITKLLGLSQIEMAVLLGVTRTQWSMYEIGKRDLPLSAKQQLTLLLSHIQDLKEVSKQSQELSALEQQKTMEWLKQEHGSIEYKKQLLERKAMAIENKRKESFAALEMVQFLEANFVDKALSNV